MLAATQQAAAPVHRAKHATTPLVGVFASLKPTLSSALAQAHNVAPKQQLTIAVNLAPSTVVPARATSLATTATSVFAHPRPMLSSVLGPAQHAAQRRRRTTADNPEPSTAVVAAPMNLATTATNVFATQLNATPNKSVAR